MIQLTSDRKINEVSKSTFDEVVETCVLVYKRPQKVYKNHLAQWFGFKDYEDMWRREK